MKMNKSMILMMLVCLGAMVVTYVVPTEMMSGGIGFFLLAAVLLACCIPMIKMILTGKQTEINTE